MKESTLSMAMQDLIDPERSPEVIRICFNDTETVLAKTVDEESKSVYYVGVPVGKTGKRCHYAMTIQSNGFIRGSAAMNFIANGGWKKGSKKPTRKEKSEKRASFVRAFLAAAIHLQGHQNFDDLTQWVSTESGISCSKGVNTEEELLNVALMGVPSYAVDVAIARGLRFDVDVTKFMERYVQSAYAQCTEGKWDGESKEVATTSNLPQAYVTLMRRAGLRFEKVVGKRKSVSK